MPAIATLKQEIEFNKRLGGLLDALKGIAVQQFQVLERSFKTNPACPSAIATIAATFDLEHLAHPLTRSSGPIGVIAVTSDTGLLGGLNQQVVTAAAQEFRREPGELMVVGERGVTYARERGLSCHHLGGMSEGGRHQLAATVRDYALNRVLSGRLAALSIVYPRAISFTIQRVELIRALPCWEWLREGTVPRGIRSGPVMLESPLPGVLEYLAWLWLGQTMSEVLGYSRLAELAARSVHLESSSQELQRRGKKLWGRYFRERHEIIDRNMRELFAARSLYQS